MKNIGIWIDKKNTYIVSLRKGETAFETIFSNVEHYHVKGGSGSKFKGGPQDVVQDSKYLEREKQQLKAYYSDIISKIEKADALAIFGPAESKNKFQKEINEHHKLLSQKVKIVQAADSMTKNQLIAMVKAFYQNPQ
jgi:stalled ribosome rescue protein Dom34